MPQAFQADIRSPGTWLALVPGVFIVFGDGFAWDDGINRLSDLPYVREEVLESGQQLN